MWCQILLVVQCNFLLRFRLGITDDTGLFSMPLIPGSLVACSSTASASARLILSSAAASRADPDESPFNRASILLRHASLWVCCRPSSQEPAPKTTFTETPLIEVCSSLLCSPPALRQHHLSQSLQTDVNIECIVTAIRRPWNGSHSPDVRCACLDRQPLHGDNRCL